MRVNLSRAQADEVCRTEYGNRLLSNVLYNSDSPHDPDWWATRSKAATSAGRRRLAAIRAYLSLARYAAVPLFEHTFPAVFDFNDGTKAARVDKGTIKALKNNRLLNYRTERHELLFHLTTEGTAWLNQTPPGQSTHG
jgi:hypothetical protein